ncbi:MAG: broad specificity phosphatase PhoE [Cellvibrionaceae bacterium]|jgi:broad specificity phosphatase PhoE
MKRLYITRHGFRLDHEDKNWKTTAGRPFDSPLSSVGHLQAHKTAVALKNEGITAIYSSPLRRAVQTATPVADMLNLSLHLENGIIEWLNPKWYNYDGWQQSIESRLNEFPRIAPDYRPLVEPRYPENHESVAGGRGNYTARHLIYENEGPVLLVTHGVIVMTLVEAFTGSRTGVKSETCAITILEKQSSGWVLKSSSTDHLSKELKEDKVEFI